MREMILKTKGISAGYHGHAVVQGVEISQRAGEILTLIGPNGSGKSTLLKTIAAQLAPIGGTVWLTGKSLDTLTGKEISRKMALVLTTQMRTDRLTCEDVVSAGRYPYTGALGLLSAQDRKKVEEAMAMVQALELRNADFNEISDGQRQRILLARAICQEPQVIVLDEPTSFLDIKYKLELLSILKTMAKERSTAIILSLHELELARIISDQVLCIKDGRIEKSGSPQSVLTEDYICHLYDLKKEDYLLFFGPTEKEPQGEDAPAFAYYIETGGKRLRCGYTTGTCAALAAAAATELLLTGVAPKSVRLVTPKGIPVEVVPQYCEWKNGVARCGVRKDAGDDIDATANILIFAEVMRTAEKGIVIEGGKGVGRVTKAGLDQPVGAAAINRVPRQMIAEAVEKVCHALGEEIGLKVTLSVPDGEEIARKTFNPNLGIIGGISIIGTSGIVEPMSIQALIDTKKIELRQAALENPERVILTPGNYGTAFLKEHPIEGGETIPTVVCSNFIGELLDAAGAEQIKEVLLVGHIGKLVKLAGGIMNTHSRWGDCRTELFCAHAALCGAGRAVCEKLMEAATTDACIELLMQAGLWDAVEDSLLTAIQKHLDRRAAGKYTVGAVVFSNVYGELGKTHGAEKLMRDWAQKGEDME